MRDIRKERPVVRRGPLDRLQANELRGRPAAVDPGRVPSGVPAYGDLVETGFAEQISDQEAPEVPHGEDDLPGQPSQGAALGEADEIQSESDDELGVEEQAHAWNHGCTLIAGDSILNGIDERKLS